MSTVLNKNLKIIHASTENSLIHLQVNELQYVLQQAIAINDIETMANATNLYTQSFVDINYKPVWLQSEFESNEWKIVFHKNKSIANSSSMVILWSDIKLEDGSFLTESQHENLLNTFKYWIINIDNPIINGGRLTSSGSNRVKLYNVLKLIECIILNGSVIRLSDMHLSLMSLDFLIDILISVSTVDEFGIPNYLKFKDNARKELLEASTYYMPAENRVCILNVFNFSENEYKQVNNFLFHKCMINDVFDSNEFRKIAFKRNLFSMMTKIDFFDGIIHKDYKPKEKFYGLYSSVESTENISNNIGCDEVNGIHLGGLVKLLKQLSFAANQSEIILDHTSFGKLNFNLIARLLEISERGRYKTLPIKPILNLMRDTFEFSFSNIDTILKSVIAIFEFQIDTSYGKISLNEISRSKFPDIVNQLYPDKICCGDYLSCHVDVDRRKVSLYSNTIINKFNILISSIQFLFAVFSAKRSSEISSLKPYSNLVPNINPDDADYNQLFSVESLVMKTGVGGPNETKAITQRPMIRSVARLMWKVEAFNKTIMQMGIELPSLFNLLTGSEKRLTFAKSPVISPYKYICDYFDMPFINENGVPKKLYFSNHQLRRFFAMMFFWSNGYDGLDSIRWMLGHSSSEHLYHYITESNSGAVLNGVKATHLVNEIQNGKLETIDLLRKAISQYYDVAQANIEIERLSDAVRDYVDDEDYETNPSYISDRDINAIEDTIYQLLHDDVIRLEPTFFSVERGGVTVQDYRMILEVRELF